MEESGIGQTLMVIVGPILLAAVLIWAILRNRAQKNSLPDTEAATRDLYKSQNAIDKAKDNEVQR